MFRRLALVAACALAISAANAQQLQLPQTLSGPSTQAPPAQVSVSPDREREIDAAFKVCMQHGRNRIEEPHSTSQYAKGWEHCADINKAWQETTAAREQRQREDQDKQNLDRTKALADKLKAQ